MKILLPLFFITGFSFCLFITNGCGQTGPLYMPDTDQTQTTQTQ